MSRRGEAAQPPRLSPAYFRTAADFCGIRSNSSKITDDLCRTFGFTAEKKKGRTRRLQRRISPLCGLVGCLPDFPFARRTGRFLRLFRQRKDLLFIYFSAVELKVLHKSAVAFEELRLIPQKIAAVRK